MPASSSRRKGTTVVKRSAALSGHRAAKSQSSVDLSPVGTHSRHSSLSAITLDHESDYISSAEGHDDEDEDDSDDDTLLAEQNDGNIPVTMLRHGRDVHPTWVKSSIETLSNTRVWGFCSTRAKSEEDFDSY